MKLEETINELWNKWADCSHKTRKDLMTKDAFTKAIADLQVIPKIAEIIEKVNNEHPYKEVGNRDSYSQYNEGWEDACTRIIDILATEEE